MVQRVKDLALSLKQLAFDPWPGQSHISGPGTSACHGLCQKKKKKKSYCCHGEECPCLTLVVNAAGIQTSPSTSELGWVELHGLEAPRPLLCTN